MAKEKITGAEAMMRSLEMALNYNVDAAKLEEKQAQQATPVQQDTDETSTN